MHPESIYVSDAGRTPTNAIYIKDLQKALREYAEKLGVKFVEADVVQISANTVIEQRSERSEKKEESKASTHKEDIQPELGGIKEILKELPPTHKEYEKLSKACVQLESKVSALQNAATNS